MLEIGAVVYKPENKGDLVIFVTEENISQIEWPAAEVGDLISESGLEGKFGEAVSFSFLQAGRLRRLIVAGLGKTEDLDLEKFRKACGRALKEAEKLKIKELTAGPWQEELPAAGDVARALAEAAVLGSYRFDRHLSKPNDECLKSFKIGYLSERKDEVLEGAGLGEILGGATCLARDLVNEPANLMTPAQLAKEAERAGEKYGFAVEVLEEEAIENLKMEAFLQVARASTNRPRLIIMRYFGDGENSEDILGFVGKGITFDSGGLSLKPGTSLPTMKYDMGGSAAVIGAMSAIAQRKLPLNVVAVVAACENLISGAGYRPGDVIGSMAGKSILINSTDAEGRLTLADAVHYIIAEEKVTAVVDVATLTGAAIVALGNTTTGVLTNDDALYKKLQAASEKSGERVWQLPSFPEYRELNKTPLADLANTGGRAAGTITAGLFIEEFVQETPWLHLDIAGTAYTSKNLDYTVEGATGVGVRLLYHLAEDFVK
ncbi:MAG TPA: leucyl aminopeptidase [Firmicutes bacterium]|nr:leucyl aminopeptidase [Bacillota bacterium]